MKYSMKQGYCYEKTSVDWMIYGNFYTESTIVKSLSLFISVSK